MAVAPPIRRDRARYLEVAQGSAGGGFVAPPIRRDRAREGTWSRM